jgi:hypothetical protein
MTEEQTALARRAVACRGWRWMAGMLCIWPNGNEWRVAQVSGIDGVNDCPNYPAGGWGDDYSDRTTGLPDLTDPATLGCLLALVREAWRCPTVYVRQGTTRRVSDNVMAWEVCDLWLDAEACRALGVDRPSSVGSWGHGSEAEALVAALEAAPSAKSTSAR